MEDDKIIYSINIEDVQNVAQQEMGRILTSDELAIVEEKIGENEYVASHPEHGKYRKHVLYFLARAEFEPLKLEQGKGGLDDAKWFRLQDIIDLNFYDDMLPIVTVAVQKLLDHSSTHA